MTVAELIAQLQTMPQDLPVSVNDELGGNFHEDVEMAYHMEEFYGDRACVILAVNT